LGVVSQRLMPLKKGGRIPAVEIMVKNNAVENLIRSQKVYQINNVIETGMGEGMVTLDRSLADLVREGLVDQKEALKYVRDEKNFKILLGKF